MKNDPFTFSELFILYREQLGYSFVACAVALCRHWQLRDPFREVFSDALMCAFLAFGISSVLSYFGIDSKQWGYLTSIAVGYLGFKTIWQLITDRVPLINTRKADDVQTKRKEPE